MCKTIIFHLTFIFIVSFTGITSSACAFSDEKVWRNYTNPSISDSFITNIELNGNILHIAKFKYWLNEISKIPIGKETLKIIIDSPHSLTITSKKAARVSAGRTIASMTEALTNGKGENVEIWFDGSIPERGSHMVYNSHKELVEYTAVENLFHELVHARHKMKGTWLYFDSEGQAIAEENVFRSQYNTTHGKPPNERTYKTGVPIEAVAGYIESVCEKDYKIRANPPLTINKPCT